VGQSSLADAGHVFDKQMAAGNQADNTEAHRFRLAFDNGFNGRLQAN